MQNAPAAQDFWLENLGEAGRFNRWVFSRFERHLGPNVLEIGCGSGNFTSLIAQSGHRVTGVDVDSGYVDAARRKLAPFPDAKLICADATAMEWDESFDTVVLLDVLEHIERDRDFLLRLRGVLKPGGKLILKVPAGRWLYGPMDDAVGHWRRYDKDSLGETIRAAQLAPLEMSYFNMAAMFGWWLNGRVLRRATPPSEQIKLFETLVPIFKVTEAALGPPMGLSLIAVAGNRAA